MKFHSLFVGIDRYDDPRINWLSGAVRDATALHALFADTIPSSSHVLLTDADATVRGIRSALETLVAEAGPDDVVFIFYAGHGSDTHEIVCYDTDVADLAATSLPLDELADTLSRINGKTVLCALDCCFSGGLGSRVFATGLTSRGMTRTTPTNILSRFIGTGRLVLTASADDEEALESALHRHGLFTYRLLEALQGLNDVGDGDQIDVLKVVGYVTQRVLADASQMGRVQTPTLRGQVDGRLLWPTFTAGSQYGALFPDRVRQPATSNPASLLAYGLPQEVLDVWSGSISQLNDLQLRAINDHGVLDGKNLVVTAPTSSGKTMIGELAAIKAAASRGRTVFLLPMKALVNDKYEQFTRAYGPLGIKTIRATGDYSDQVSEFQRGQYDFALLTYEKLTHLALANPHILDSISVVVIDEAQTLTDRNRGSNLEFLMTLLNNRRGLVGSPQIITLSAVVGDLGGLDRWIGGGHLHSTTRPVDLREGVIGRSGVLQFVAADGSEGNTPAFIQPIYHEGSRSIVIPLVKRLVGEGKKVIVFRETKGEVAGCAVYLSAALGLPPATSVLEAMSSGEASASTETLRRTLSQGVALHTADLDRTERQAIESAFRDPDSGLNVIVGTTTLAMGVNTPAEAVVIVGLTHPGPTPTPYTVAEYKNMVGRAGRLGFSTNGESYLIPNDTLGTANAWRNYVHGDLEPLRSQLVPDGDPRTLMLRVVAQFQGESGQSVTDDDVIGFLDSSLAAQQAREGGGQQWTRDQLTYGFDQLVDARLIEADADGYRLTSLGRFAGESGVHVDSIIRLSSALSGVDIAGLKSTTIIAAAQLTVEVDGMYIPISGRKNNPEPQIWPGTLARQEVDRVPLRALQQTARDTATVVRRAKKAMSAIYFINGVEMSTLEASLNQHVWGRPAMAGVVRTVADRTRDLLPAVGAVLAELYPDNASDVQTLVSRTITRLEFGIPPDLIDLARLGLGLSRQQLLAMKNLGLTDLQEVVDADLESLSKVVGGKKAAETLQAACRATTEQPASTEIDLAPPTE
ncbi:DEAD/DEAH box helicase [Mycolicibacterium sp. 120266]|uniref:DEAD/DEAH box helicase n=1 Tax=Mycolicibacterium sp. 120266 TaxID=3090601 RepID=UPI00299EC8FA|nr:DEAD/DEAH box helicase [Mycolicibacterium sp. 120266]MDX1870683.1 DEAD/DEAH box helicase [Mycolicibacterium sp. 120266]